MPYWVERLFVLRVWHDLPPDHDRDRWDDGHTEAESVLGPFNTRGEADGAEDVVRAVMEVVGS